VADRHLGQKRNCCLERGKIGLAQIVSRVDAKARIARAFGRAHTSVERLRSLAMRKRLCIWPGIQFHTIGAELGGAGDVRRVDVHEHADTRAERFQLRDKRLQPCRIDGALPEAPAHFDRTQIAQALLNLVKNARESGGAVEQIEIAVAACAGEYRIEVRDRGPGMSETVMAQAVLPFYSTKRNGTGLGLALVREIAEAHGGGIRLSNREGGGLCAMLTLPAPDEP